MSFKDHFSGHAGAYAKARPGYPAALFDWLESVSPGHELAWDVGTGNGQAARSLANGFARVHATDASAEQIARASAPSSVHFACEPAEASSLGDSSADLVTVAQALHWFEFSTFYREVKRVLRPRGVFAAWTYQLNRISPEIDAVVDHFFEEVIGPYWPPERVHVEAGYEDLPFPFERIEPPEIKLDMVMTLGEFLAYLDTWSAVRRYRAARNQDPLESLLKPLSKAWGGEGKAREVLWPLAIRAGRMV